MVCYLFSFYIHTWSSLTQRIAPHRLLYCIFENLPWSFAAGICHGNLPQEFAVAICDENLPWKFAVAICRGIFVYVRESFFVYVSKSCVYGSKPFLYVSKTFLICEIFFINSVFLFTIVVAVMGHRRVQIYSQNQIHKCLFGNFFLTKINPRKTCQNLSSRNLSE